MTGEWFKTFYYHTRCSEQNSPFPALSAALCSTLSQLLPILQPSRQFQLPVLVLQLSQKLPVLVLQHSQQLTSHLYKLL